MAAEHRGATPVEVAFRAVAHRLVQQHARPAGPQHHRHIAGRRRHRAEVDQRHAHRFFGVSIGAHLTIDGFREVVIAETAAAAAGTALTLAILLHQHADGEAHQWANIRRQRAVGSRHQHLLVNAGDAGVHFLHPCIGGTRHLVDAVQQGDFLFARQALQRIEQRVQRPVTDLARGVRPPVAPAHARRCAPPGTLLQRIQGDLIGIGEAGLLAADGAHADAPVDIVRAILDDAVLDHPAS